MRLTELVVTEQDVQGHQAERDSVSEIGSARLFRTPGSEAARVDRLSVRELDLEFARLAVGRVGGQGDVKLLRAGTERELLGSEATLATIVGSDGKDGSDGRVLRREGVPDLLADRDGETTFLFGDESTTARTRTAVFAFGTVRNRPDLNVVVVNVYGSLETNREDVGQDFDGTSGLRARYESAKDCACTDTRDETERDGPCHSRA